ncbi:MAG TPA: DUF4326 domain-containing protein [Chthoniobacterales bacterium]
MTTPVRLQLSRRWGFNLQRHSRSINGLPAVAVTRPGPFGNPFWMREFVTPWGDPLEPKMQREEAVSFFAIWIGAASGVIDLSDVYPDELSRLKAALPQLEGHNLACWCPLKYPDGEPCPCHAHVLLEWLSEGD